jgi:hypothetical protein
LLLASYELELKLPTEEMGAEELSVLHHRRPIPFLAKEQGKFPVA